MRAIAAMSHAKRENRLTALWASKRRSSSTVCGGSFARRARSSRARRIALSHASERRRDVSRVSMQPSIFFAMRALQNSMRLRRFDRVSACHATRSRLAAKLSPLTMHTDVAGPIDLDQRHLLLVEPREHVERDAAAAVEHDDARR